MSFVFKFLFFKILVFFGRGFGGLRKCCFSFVCLFQTFGFLRSGIRGCWEASWAVLGDPKLFWKHLGPSGRRLGSVLDLGEFLGGLGPRNVANMVPI